MSDAAAKKLVVGIDLGTTHSLVAVCEGGRPRILRNALGEVMTPSVVAIEESDVLIGTPARDRARTSEQAAASTAANFKRDMGTEKTYRLGERQMSPAELSACVLRALVADAKAALGRPIDEAVISVPAYFNDAQRRATRQAAELAGLHVERLINEPTAAAIAHGLQSEGEQKRAIVLDLGGGTFDVTVLEIIDTVIEIQATAGDVRLGGEDFTLALVDHLAVGLAEEAEGEAAAAAQPGSQSFERLRAACETAKRLLSRQEVVEVALADLEWGGRKIELARAVTREQAETLWRPILERVRQPILRALRDAGVDPAKPDAIDEVLLVGGASRMPCFIDLARELFGREPRADLAADEVVALGCALQASLKAGDEALDDLIVTDLAGFSLGVEVVDFFAGRAVEGVFSPILERGTVIPVSRERGYWTVCDGQTEVFLNVYQGEHPTCAKNTRIGQLVVDGVPPAPAGMQQIGVRFSYDLDGVLEVEATVKATEKTHALVLEQSPGRLGEQELAAARRRMDGLKFHPRDALPNTAALGKAEALYVEMRGAEREEVARLISAFRATLDKGDEVEIESLREHLLAWIESRKAPI